jgi:hypothetical protein
MNQDNKPVAPNGAPMIHAAMCRIMAEVGAVGKLGENKEQRYPFRKIADVYKACQAVFARNGVHFLPHKVSNFSCAEVASKSGTKGFHVTAVIEHRFYAVDGSYVTVETIGESTDWSDKACNKVMSAAAKYAMGEGLCLPDEDPESDGDHESPEIADPLQQLWDALDRTQMTPAERKAFCEKTLGRPVPTANTIFPKDMAALLSALEKPAAVAPPPATFLTGAKELNAALDKLSPWGSGCDGLSAKDASDYKKASKLSWANGILRLPTPVTAFAQLKPEQVTTLITSATNGEMPETADDMPAWANEGKKTTP